MSGEKSRVLSRLPFSLRVVAGALAALLVVALLLGFHFRERKEALPRTVRIAFVGTVSKGGKPELTGASALIAEQGFLESELEKRGVALQWVPMPNAAVGPMTNEAFANGGIDFANYSELPSIIANANGIRTKLIVPSGRGGDTFLVVPAGSTAQSIHDLVGKRIAVHKGRPWELPFIRLLDSIGRSYEDFEILNLNPETGVAALVANKIDGLVITTTAYQLEERKVARIVWSTVGKPLDWKTLGGLWVKAEFAEAYPELTQLVTTAYVKANYWSSQEENRPAMVELAARLGTPKSVIERDYSTSDVTWKERWSPLFDETLFSHYKTAIAYAVEKGIIAEAFDFRESSDPRFVERAISDLGLTGYWSGVRLGGSGNAPEPAAVPPR
jgi:sulfonate transport system substrate-binding protein